MNYTRFIKTLQKWYWGIPNTRMCCKFYLQYATFSFEIHDTNEICFGPKSLVFESKTYFHPNKGIFQTILNDIQTKALELNEI